MTSRAGFGQICRRVCEQQGWELLPAGVRVSLPSDRHQLVQLEFFEHAGQELVRLYSEIGDAEALATSRLVMALQINARLAHGALAVRDGRLTLADTLLLQDADPGEIEAALSYLAETADYYERVLYRTDEN